MMKEMFEMCPRQEEIRPVRAFLLSNPKKKNLMGALCMAPLEILAKNSRLLNLV